ncbi:T-cell surface glycoprotein CD1e, membrane-associated-like [Eulemur rufifrons]|uniref:T-cell surface glycoprotein CD1e, membrane-associated-like n=1 Tax=Eulemur rufifrons TaxID=859984 RepID=UPI003741FD87
MTVQEGVERGADVCVPREGVLPGHSSPDKAPVMHLLLLLLLLLFRELGCPRESTAVPQALGSHHPAAEKAFSFHMLQISSFANHSWVHIQGPVWVGDLQTHSWDGIMGTICFLRSWSQGDCSKEELKNLQALLQVYLCGFSREVQAFASQFSFNASSLGWVSTGPNPGPGHLLLVCHVSGFNPKPVWVRWMQGEQEQSGTQHSDLLPNADGTWYLRATLDVAAWEAPGLSCWVKHSSLRGHDIIIHWGGYSILLILICLTVLVILVMFAAVDSWFEKQW